MTSVGNHIDHKNYKLTFSIYLNQDLSIRSKLNRFIARHVEK